MFSETFQNTTATLPDSPRAGKLSSCLKLLARLETSLGASRKALLAHDLEGIERANREQAKWQRMMVELFMADGDGLKKAGRRQFESAPELRAAAARVLALGRVQALLLKRAQRSLATTANLLSGPGASYNPTSTSHYALPGEFRPRTFPSPARAGAK